MVVGLVAFAATALLAFASGASGATRYVDNSGSPRCKDSGSYGSEAKPWCTIGYGIAPLAGGDELVVKHGTYEETPYITGPAGTSARPTVIRAEKAQIVTIRGRGNTGRVKIASTRYLTFDGFVITNVNQGIFVEASDHIAIQHCTIHDIGQEAINIHQNSSDVTVEGCTIYNTQAIGPGNANGEGVYVGTGSRGPLDNTHHVTLRGNTIHDVTDEGIELKPGTHDCIVEHNTIYRSGSHWIGKEPNAGSGIEVNERDLGVETWTGNPNHVISGNLVYDQASNAIRLGTGSTAYNNVVYGVARDRAAILVNDNNRDGFTRFVYHNTLDTDVRHAVVVQSGNVDARNNIGPASLDFNLAFDAGYFVDAAGHDYHLVPGAAPVNAGTDLTTMVPADKDGNQRSDGKPDVGAYELTKTLQENCSAASALGVSCS